MPPLPPLPPLPLLPPLPPLPPRMVATVATVATVPALPRQRGRGNVAMVRVAVATLPWQRCRGNVAVATLPWRRCHGARCHGNGLPRRALPWRRGQGTQETPPWPRDITVATRHHRGHETPRDTTVATGHHETPLSQKHQTKTKMTMETKHTNPQFICRPTPSQP